MNILFKSAFDKLGLQEKELRAYPNTLFGLEDSPIQPLGYIPLHTTFGKGTRSRILSIDYIVVNVSSAYNTLIGQTTLNQLTAMVSTPYLCMKFPTTEGITTIKGDQKLARRYYNESLNLKGDPRKKETNTIEIGGIQAREELRPQPEDETEEVQIEDTQDKTTNIKANLKGDLKELLTKLLKDNSDLFAWKAADMPGIDLGLVCHKLAVYHRSRLVQQKQRKLSVERSQAIEEQVQALLKAGFIRENTGATYQRLMNRVFANHIRKLMKFYIDDMLVKTQREETLLSDLTEVFNAIRKHGMRLNPAKCTFMVEAGKFLGFMLTQRGIEANPDKFQAIHSMKSPTYVKEV
ncbi:uncharacterized protein LOC107479859 [Arachis duranensis]|uniref:Uncharacterized protein LOC107479859 n=1 Tax=Arachis duranensis TaxID=130453 RepID=A0A6P4CQ63_ARADU|nr:uncharacterized protein LOC107479859 [Arachis duranensis]